MNKLPYAKRYTHNLNEAAMRAIADHFRHTGIPVSAVIRALIDRFAMEIGKAPRRMTLEEALEATIAFHPLSGDLVSEIKKTEAPEEHY